MIPDNIHASVRTGHPQADDQRELLKIEHDLKDSGGVVLIRDIGFDRASGFLTFHRRDSDQAQRPITMKLHPDDQVQFLRLAGRSEVSVSLRPVRDSFASFVLILEQNAGDAAWRSGTLTHIEGPKDLLDTIAAKSRLEDLGEKASVLGHELRQPLFTIAMANENLRLMLGAPKQLQSLLFQAIDRIDTQVQRAQTIIALTLGYATGSDASSEHSDVGQALRRACDFLAPLFETADIRIEIDTRMSGTAALSGVQQEQVFVNVLRNAVDSIQARRQEEWSGEGSIVATLQTDGDYWRCLVSDNGAGLAPDVPERKFRPFFTTKSDQGTGLGLYVCEQLVTIAGGSIRLLPGEREGAMVEILLPRRDAR